MNLRVEIFSAEGVTCNHCGNNVNHHSLVYDDEIEYTVQIKYLISELSLDSIVREEHSSEAAYPLINKAFRELTLNPDAYEEFKSAIDTVKIFLWGIRLSLEDFPKGIIKFVKQKSTERYEKTINFNGSAIDPDVMLNRKV